MLKIGDSVIIDKLSVLEFFGEIPDFYSDDIFTIIKLEDGDVVKLDKNLNGDVGRQFIHTSFIKSITEERREKLKKINEKKVSVQKKFL